MLEKHVGSMGNTRTTTDLQQLVEAFINNLNKRFDEVEEYLNRINSRLTAIEQACIKEDTNAATIMADLEHASAIKKLKAETKCTMGTVGRALLKTKMEDPHSSSTLEIMQEVTNNLFTISMI